MKGSLRAALTIAVLMFAMLAGHLPALTLNVTAQSQTIDPVLLDAYRWRSVATLAEPRANHGCPATTHAHARIHTTTVTRSWTSE